MHSKRSLVATEPERSNKTQTAACLNDAIVDGALRFGWALWSAWLTDEN